MITAEANKPTIVRTFQESRGTLEYEVTYVSIEARDRALFKMSAITDNIEASLPKLLTDMCDARDRDIAKGKIS